MRGDSLGTLSPLVPTLQGLDKAWNVLEFGPTVMKMWVLVTSALTHFRWRHLQNFLQAFLQDLIACLESWAAEKSGAHVLGDATSRVSHGRKWGTKNKHITTEKQSSIQGSHVDMLALADPPQNILHHVRILRASASLVAPNELVQQATPRV